MIVAFPGYLYFKTLIFYHQMQYICLYSIIKLFSCSTQLRMKFSLLINMKMPTIVGIFILTEKFSCSALLSK